MNDVIQLNGPQIGEFRDALLEAFPQPNQLPQVVWVGTGVNFYNIVSQWENQQSQAFNLIVWFNSRGRVEELLDAARGANPGNPALRRFAESLGLAPPAAGPGGPEAVVLPHVPAANPEEWRATMAACERMICRVEIPKKKGIGTGFLTRADRVMTNHHVLDLVWQGTYQPEEVVLRFDYTRTAAGTERPGREYTLDLTGAGATPWVAAMSPASKLDYVVLKVNGTPGEDWVGRAKNSPKRSWVKLDRAAAQVNDPLMILQHPDGERLQYAMGSVTKVDNTARRLVHNASTKNGSSGSPCFSGNWAVVALHHYGDQKAGNRSVLFPAVLDELKGRQDIFGS
jgi:hypothetical protein